jgi:hypothetical protein
LFLCGGMVVTISPLIRISRRAKEAWDPISAFSVVKGLRGLDRRIR